MSVLGDFVSDLVTDTASAIYDATFGGRRKGVVRTHILLIALGFVGAHRFYLHDYWMGLAILGLFVGGGFTFGLPFVLGLWVLVLVLVLVVDGYLVPRLVREFNAARDAEDEAERLSGEAEAFD